MDRERESLWMRGLTDDQIAEFGIGHSEEPLLFNDACARMRDVFSFPLTNSLGEIRGVQLRYRTQKGYRDYFDTSEEPVLFGLAQAMPHVWETGTVYLVEGVYDLFPVRQVCPYVVSVLKGSVPSSLIPLLRRMVDRVILGFDNDKTGQNGAWSFAKDYRSEFECTVIKYPLVKMADDRMTKDPGDLWEVWGQDRLNKYLRRTLNL